MVVTAAAKCSFSPTILSPPSWPVELLLQLGKPIALRVAIKNQRETHTKVGTEAKSLATFVQMGITRPDPFRRVAHPTNSHIEVYTFLVGTQAKMYLL